MRIRLGEDHPITLSCEVNLANCLGDAGDLDQAAQQQRETIVKLTAKLGDRHPDTLACQANLAATLHRAGRDDEAGPLRQRLRAAFIQVLGERHPDTIALENWQWIDRDVETQPT